MDLESESSLLESVDDNGMIQQNHINNSDNGSFSDESVKLVSPSPAIATKIEKTIEKPMNFDSPGVAAHSPISKGQGLRKWRRIKRDLVKDTSANMENSKVLKRGLSGSAHSHGKQMQIQSPEPEESQGSVGSVNMLRNVGDDSYDSRFMVGIGFTAGVDSDDRSSKSSTAAKISKAIRYEKAMMVSSGQREKSRVENSKKHRGESVETEKENSHSSLESDSRKQTGKMMYYNGENGDEFDRNGEASKRKDDLGEEGEESVNENSRFVEEIDPLTEAIDDFVALQEALVKEVQQFREIGKEPMPQHDELIGEVTSPRGEIVTLVNNIEQLKNKLEETKSMIELKESHIHELESTTNRNKHLLRETGTLTETAVEEDIFRQRIEAEIEHLIYSKSIDNLNNQMKMVEEQEQAHNMVNKLKEVETKAANLANRAQDLENEDRDINGSIKKTTSWFLIQLVLLLAVVLLFLSQMLPEAENVVPT